MHLRKLKPSWMRPVFHHTVAGEKGKLMGRLRAMLHAMQRKNRTPQRVLEGHNHGHDHDHDHDSDRPKNVGTLVVVDAQQREREDVRLPRPPQHCCWYPTAYASG